MRYAVVIEKGESNYSAHLEGMRADGLPIPEPSSCVQYVDVAA
jgi:predicted RNase H-like HicB family nuclease